MKSLKSKNAMVAVSGLNSTDEKDLMQAKVEELNKWKQNYV